MAISFWLLVARKATYSLLSTLFPSPMIAIPKRALIILAAAVALALLVLVVVRVTVRPDAREHREQVAQSASTIERARVSCNGEQNPEGCFMATVNREARRLHDASLCTALEGKAFTSCVSLVALDGEDPDVCRLLSGKEQKSCADGAYFRLATGALDLQMCEPITTETLKERCRTNIEREVVRLGQCSQYGVDDILCSDADEYRRAVASGDPLSCDRFDDDMKESCLFDMSDALQADEDLDGLSLGQEREYGTDPAAFDSDGDGLSDGEEVSVYNTNPLERDTDGDGFADGEEVGNGYNPNGDGRL